jgi:hypothetical protein
VADDNGSIRCGNPNCNSPLQKCFNYLTYQVCNRCVVPDPAIAEPLCDCCRFNQIIPDLTVEGNARRWYKLEAAKRRLFYELGELGLPYGSTDDGIDPPLRFDFKGDILPADDKWRAVDQTEKVYTSHNAGLVTINIREADDDEREKLRVDMREKHRTLIAHFRHEIGHYYWEVLIKGRFEPEFVKVFGDHNNPSYADALKRYYDEGAPENWADHYISAYATMHPWEDFAETWATYLDMVSTLDTAHHQGFGGVAGAVFADVDDLVTRYQQLGVAINELNRTQGLLDLVPEVFVPPVITKLHYIHELVQRGRQENGILQAACDEKE